METLVFKKLKDCELSIIDTVANVYLAEWPEHYAQEYNIHTIEDMKKDIIDNFLDCIYIVLINNTFAGTIALYETDLISHKHLTPWISCLYVEPDYRRNGIAKFLVNNLMEVVKTKPVYIWCDTKEKKQKYQEYGFTIIDETLALNKYACVLVKR